MSSSSNTVPVILSQNCQLHLKDSLPMAYGGTSKLQYDIDWNHDRIYLQGKLTGLWALMDAWNQLNQVSRWQNLRKFFMGITFQMSERDVSEILYMNVYVWETLSVLPWSGRSRTNQKVYKESDAWTKSFRIKAGCYFILTCMQRCTLDSLYRELDLLV